MNQRETGTKKEQLAAAYLKQRGVRILKQNFRSRQGEIDIVGIHQGYLVFVEVKYRRTHSMGGALEAVTLKKQQKICRTADFYRCSQGIGDFAPVRYDVVAIQGEEIRWIKNAFPHRYAGGR